jgi:hypothetical protein
VYLDEKHAKKEDKMGKFSPGTIFLGGGGADVHTSPKSEKFKVGPFLNIMRETPFEMLLWRHTYMWGAYIAHPIVHLCM